MSEWQFIDWVRKESLGHSNAHDRVILGPGDDAGIVRIGSSEVVVAADMLLEGVHFNLSSTPPELIGRKALAVNLSDIAAMGCRPVCALSSIAIPSHHGFELAQRITRGMIGLADQFDVALVGGDTNSWGTDSLANKNRANGQNDRVVVSVTVLGEPWSGVAPVRRSGAKPGDFVLVTGALGGSLGADDNGHHLSFMPRINESEKLVKSTAISAMIDLSDGLSTDAAHIAAESKITIQLNPDTIPIRGSIQRLPRKDQLHHAMTDGEDFELLFTAAPEAAERLIRTQPLDGITISQIGVCKAGEPQVIWSDGTPVPQRGFEHVLTR